MRDLCSRLGSRVQLTTDGHHAYLTAVERAFESEIHSHISTSFVERQNLTMRMSMRRFTRLTNGFSKEAEHHAPANALHFMHYNFCRVHQTWRCTPAMEAALSDHVWSLEKLIGSLDRRNAEAA